MKIADWSWWTVILEDPFGPPPPPPPPDPRFGRPGIRDPDAVCEAFDGIEGGPKVGDCDTDGHYLCDECSRMSLKAFRQRHDLCTRCGVGLVHWNGQRTHSAPDACPSCDAEWVEKERRVSLPIARAGVRASIGSSNPTAPAVRP